MPCNRNSTRQCLNYLSKILLDAQTVILPSVHLPETRAIWTPRRSRPCSLMQLPPLPTNALSSPPIAIPSTAVFPPPRCPTIPLAVQLFTLQRMLGPFPPPKLRWQQKFVLEAPI